MHKQGICELPGVGESWSILREILIKTQLITIPLKKENERPKQHLLWSGEGLLKEADREGKGLWAARQRPGSCLLSTGHSWWGPKRAFRVVLAQGADSRGQEVKVWGT